MKPSAVEAAPESGRQLLLQIEGQPGTNLPTRVAAGLREAVRMGRLGPGSRLPSSRSLAADLGVSRGVVVAAYLQLVEERVLSSQAGSGTRVADSPQLAGSPATTARTRAPSSDPPSIELRPGSPDLSTFPRTAWTAAVRDALRTLPSRELGYVEPWGTKALRLALSEYLSRVRGAAASPRAVVVVSGATQGLTILVRVLRSEGHRELALESPSNPVQRRVLASHGLRLVDVPVDEEGIDVQALARTSCRAVLVAPSHQFPTGVRMSPERRVALLRWAEETGGVVIEDDHDAEFVYERPPTPCLQSLAPHRVALVGSVSNTLAPGLRLGWVIAPQALLETVRAVKRNDDFGTGVIEQHALAQLLGSGAFDRHVRTLRFNYRRRRATLLDAVERHLPGWRPSGIAAGLHVLLMAPAGVNEEMLIAEAASRELLLQGASHMYGELDPEPGLVVSYARVPMSLLGEGVHRLAEAVHATARNPGGVVPSELPAAATPGDYA